MHRSPGTWLPLSKSAAADVAVRIQCLSLRVDAVAGVIAERVLEDPANFQPTSSRLIILIHGYNKSKIAAQTEYEEFLSNSGLQSLPLEGQVCEFFWPGDKKWGVFKPLCYPWEIETARIVAERLHRFLTELRAPGGWPLSIALVCHSLGNRVALELVSRLDSGQSPGHLHFRIRCLMAAAVPVFMVEPGGELRPPALRIGRSLALHSTKDRVLQWAFPIGETAAGEGFFPSAVGRKGKPGGTWTQSEAVQGYAHHDYWIGPESATSVRAFFGAPVERPLPTAFVPGRDLEQAIPLDERTLPIRELQARSIGD